MAETLSPSILPIILLARLCQFRKLRFVNMYRQYMRRRRRKRHHSGCGFACGIQALLPRAVAGLLISPKWNLERKVFERFSKVLSSHSSLSHKPKTIGTAKCKCKCKSGSKHKSFSAIYTFKSQPQPNTIGRASSSPSPVPRTNLSGIKRKELTNCLQYLQPEQPGLSHEPYYDEDLSIPNSPDISGVERQPSLSNGYEPYNSKLSSQDLYMEEANSSGMHGSHYQDKISQLKQKSTVLNHVKPFPKQNSSLDLYEDSAGETSLYNSKRNQRMSSKHGVEGMRIDSVTNHRGHYDGKIESEMHDYANVSPNVIQRSEYFKFKPPNLIHDRFELLDTEERGLSTRMKKEEKVNRKWKGIKEHGNQVKLKMHSTNEIKVPKRVRHDLLQQDYVTKAPFT